MFYLVELFHYAFLFRITKTAKSITKNKDEFRLECFDKRCNLVSLIIFELFTEKINQLELDVFLAA